HRAATRRTQRAAGLRGRHRVLRHRVVRTRGIRTTGNRSTEGDTMTTLVEETLVLVKPDGVARSLTGEILRRIEAKGYQLVDIRLVHADRDLLAQHYEEHQGKPFYEPLVEFMESGPVVAVRVA